MRLRAVFSLLALFVLLGTGYAQVQSPKPSARVTTVDRIVAVVNNEVITQYELQSRINDSIQELNRHGIFAIQFLADHFRKERTSLFPTARSELTPQELETIRSRLESA